MEINIEEQMERIQLMNIPKGYIILKDEEYYEIEKQCKIISNKLKEIERACVAKYEESSKYMKLMWNGEMNRSKISASEEVAERVTMRISREILTMIYGGQNEK